MKPRIDLSSNAAEILAGIAFTQMIAAGAPVLYGSVPVRARLDDLHDLYGCPEFNQYNIDCAQLARYYKIPCYSSAGVGDAKVPGMQWSAAHFRTWGRNIPCAVGEGVGRSFSHSATYAVCFARILISVMILPERKSALRSLPG